jgi:nicotinamide-nucleotide amidase
MIGVPTSLITAHGAVSEPVARAMAQGALDHSRANLSVAITGIAGPGGGSPDKPVGLVHFACAERGQPVAHVAMRFDDTGRSGIRRAALDFALALLEKSAAKL